MYVILSLFLLELIFGGKYKIIHFFPCLGDNALIRLNEERVIVCHFYQWSVYSFLLRLYC